MDLPKIFNEFLEFKTEKNCVVMFLFWQNKTKKSLENGFALDGLILECKADKDCHVFFFILIKKKSKWIISSGTPTWQFK
jgi:hypothetical protein